MNFKEYAEENGLTTSFLCRKLFVTRQTVYRLMCNDSVSDELAQRVRDYLSPEIKVNISNSISNHIRRRKSITCVV